MSARPTPVARRATPGAWALAPAATLALVAALALTAAALAPATAQAADRDLAVTVYNQNLALVKDTRLLDLGTGRQTFRLRDVSAQIDATSVHLAAHAGGPLTVLEQNYQYDLVSADKVLDRYIDHDVTLTGKDGKVSAGTLLSYDGANLVLDRKPGIAIVNRAEVKEIACAELPGGLITRPTLVWFVDNAGAARREATLSYLTGGLSWHAEYVAVIEPSDRGMSWAGWVSLENASGTSFPDARLKLVAGDVHRVQEPRPVPQFETMVKAMGARDASQFEEQTFFEYHLYALDRRTTLADKETKQLALFPTADVPATKVYTFDRTKDPKKVAVTMEFKNAKSAGLGMALPMGKVRVYKQDETGAEEFVGEDRIDHTPKDETVRITVGNAFDVTPEYRQVDFKRVSDKETETSHEITLRNHKSETARVKVVEHTYGDWRVTTSSPDFVKKDASTLEFTVDVPPDGTKTVTYTIRQK